MGNSRLNPPGAGTPGVAVKCGPDGWLYLVIWTRLRCGLSGGAAGGVPTGCWPGGGFGWFDGVPAGLVTVTVLGGGTDGAEDTVDGAVVCVGAMGMVPSCWAPALRTLVTLG